MNRGKIELRYGVDGSVAIHLELAEGTVWLTKNEIAYLLGTRCQKIASNLRALFKDRLLFENQTTILHNGITLYNLDAIIALSFRISDGYCSVFREWVAKQIKNTVPESKKPSMIIWVDGNSFINN